jgi:hypothetical protein
MNGSSHPKHENTLKNNVLARILALLMGAARPPTSRNGRAADAIVPNMACMQDTRTEEPGGVFSWETSFAKMGAKCPHTPHTSTSPDQKGRLCGGINDGKIRTRLCLKISSVSVLPRPNNCLPVAAVERGGGPGGTRSMILVKRSGFQSSNLICKKSIVRKEDYFPSASAPLIRSVCV